MRHPIHPLHLPHPSFNWLGQGQGTRRCDEQEEKGKGERDPKETRECKQVAEEEVRRGEGVLGLSGPPGTKNWIRPCP